MQTGDEVLLRMFGIAEPWRIGIVTDIGHDLIRDEPYVVLNGPGKRIYESDVQFASILNTAANVG